MIKMSYLLRLEYLTYYLIWGLLWFLPYLRVDYKHNHDYKLLLNVAKACQF